MIARAVVTNQPAVTKTQAAEDLRLIHEWIGLSMAEIARAIKLEPEAVRRWYRGTARPSNFAYQRVLMLKRFANYTWLAMPFNSVGQRHRWWITPNTEAGELLSPFEAFRSHRDPVLQRLIETQAPRYGRTQLALAA